VDLDLVFLGTAGSMPSAQRNPAALLVRRGGDRLLFDCGEGTQRQLLRSTVGLVELQQIFITHFHADHVLGLPGMFKTFALRGRELPLEVYGPRGLVDLLASLKRVVGRLSYEVRVNEVEPGDVLERDGYRLATFAVAHAVSSLGWALIEATRAGRFDVERADALGVPNGPERGALQRGEAVTLSDGRSVAPDDVLGPSRPGRKIVMTGDTAPSEQIVEAAWGGDVLVTEATFSEEERERARETRHQTAAQAAELAFGALQRGGVTYGSPITSSGSVMASIASCACSTDDSGTDTVTESSSPSAISASMPAERRISWISSASATSPATAT